MTTEIVVRSSSELPQVCLKIEMMLQKAETPQELQQVAAVASAAVTYASKFAKDQREQIEKLRAVKLEAERRLGQILQKIDKNKGGRPGKKTGNTVLPVLGGMGITKIQSSRMQALAKLPEDEWQKVKTGEKPIPRSKAKKRSRREIVIAELKEASTKTPLEAALSQCIGLLAGERCLSGKAVDLARTLRDLLDGYLEQEATSHQLVAIQ